MINENIYYKFYDFCLDVKNQELLKNGHPIQLPPKAFQLLLLLVQRAGQLVKRDDIFNQLWENSFVDDANLTQNIYLLRKVLGKAPDGQSYIKTVPKQGYLFTLKADEVSIERKPSIFKEAILTEGRDFTSYKISPEINQEISIKFREPNIEEKALTLDKLKKSVSSNAGLVSEKGRKRHLPNSLLLWLLPVSIILSTFTIYYLFPKFKPSAAGSDINSLAVLPFNSIGGDVDKENLSLGMADAVITQLSKNQTLEVRPTNAIFRYANNPSVNPTLIGIELKVDAILDGTIQVEGERFRVSVQLIRVSDGSLLWGETFYEKASDIFVIQDLISKKVVKALSLNLTPQQEEKMADRGTNNREAYQAYQRGVYFWNKRTKAELLRAVQYFQQAIEHDPNYAQAYAGLAECYTMFGYYRFADLDEMKDKAKITAEKALALDDSLAEGYSALGLVYILKGEDTHKAVELLERAVTLAPYNAAVGHRYGMALYWNGKLDEAVNQLRSAIEYDPSSPVINQALCNILIRRRSFSDAVKQCEISAELPHTPHSKTSLARAYFFGGRQSEAISQLENQFKSSPDHDIGGKLAYFYAKVGRINEAEKIYEKLKREFDKDPQRASDLALICFELGKKDQALLYFNEMLKSLDEYADLTLSLTYDPLWDEIKKDPEFAPLFPKQLLFRGDTS